MWGDVGSRRLLEHMFPGINGGGLGCKRSHKPASSGDAPDEARPKAGLKMVAETAKVFKTCGSVNTLPWFSVLGGGTGYRPGRAGGLGRHAWGWAAWSAGGELAFDGEKKRF